MKHVRTQIILSVLVLLGMSLPAFSQMNNNRNGRFNPDSLTVVTLSGTAIVDSSMMMVQYYLDEDGDAQADYHLNFGPYWYEPDSGNATRPNDGDFITVTGGLMDSTMGYQGLATMVVYEINGQFWRDPFEPFWNNMGMGRGPGNCGGYAYGWMMDSIQTVSINGVALVDTTFIFERYYLDEDADGTPDYFLNFGPPWYEPASGATRPSDGDTISVLGGLVTRPFLPMVIVYEINGQVWRDSSLFNGYMGGGWAYRNMNQPVKIRAPFDPDDWMQISPGWNTGMGGGGGMMMPDSIFGRMMQVFPQNIPNSGNQPVFAGYEVGLFQRNRQNWMWRNGSCGGGMRMGSNAQFQLHYDELQLQLYNIDENSIQVKYWDEQSNDWVAVSGATVNTATNTVTFSSNDVSNYLILTGSENVTGIDNPSANVIGKFVLKQNYPNPFNPVTTIEFELSTDSRASLTVYNVLGERVTELLNGRLGAGVHRVAFDARNLPSGIYFYELRVATQSQVRKMNLLK